MLNCYFFLPENALTCQNCQGILCMRLRSYLCEVYSKEFSMDCAQPSSLQSVGRTRKLPMSRTFFITVAKHIIFFLTDTFIIHVFLCNRQKVKIPNALPTAPVSGSSWKAVPLYIFHKLCPCSVLYFADPEIIFY